MNSSSHQFTLGIVGGRGYVGKELLQLLCTHPHIEVKWISSRLLCGEQSTSLVPELPAFEIENLLPQQVGDRQTDIVILALPNGVAEPYVKALEKNPAVKLILDLSADYREAKDWFYCLPELDHPMPQNMQKISNPGCYATAMQLTLKPIIELLSSKPHCFGVSGYSGAGTTPNPKNDPDNLKDNLLPYGLVEHGHEREVSVRLGQQVAFTPHVAEFFRGINMTVQVTFEEPQDAYALYNLFNDYYAQHPLVQIKQSIPTVQQVTGKATCLIGGFAVSEDGKSATIVACLDNLLKGAASQALQNINLALGMNTTLGLGEIL